MHLHPTHLAATILALLLVASPARANLPMLKTSGAQIVDTRGQYVPLRGVNLGGWLVEEMWMMPFVTKNSDPDGTSIKDHVTLWRTIEGRLGKDAAVRIRTALRNAWLNESDFDRMKDAGFNCVRLPFLASLDDETEKEGGGLDWLDNALAWAEKRNMYVVLDLHGAPGSQSKEHHTGEAGRNEFFTHPENIAKAEALWTKLAARYKDRSVVAGYDLLNEPMGAPNIATLQLVHDRLYRAIRAADENHIVFIEDAYRGVGAFPLPAAAGWKNVAYSLHAYGFRAQTPADQLAKLDALVDEINEIQVAYGVPVYVGEFNQEPRGTKETMQHFVGQMLRNRCAYSMWTYKIIRAKPVTSMWGYYHNTKPVEPLDPFHDTEAQMIKKLDAFRTQNFPADPRLAGVIATPN